MMDFHTKIQNRYKQAQIIIHMTLEELLNVIIN